MSSILAKIFGKSNEKSVETSNEADEEISKDEENEEIIKNDSSHDEENNYVCIIACTMKKPIMYLLFVIVIQKCKESDEKQCTKEIETESTCTPPQMATFNFITAPVVCKPGQKPDRNGICRDVW